MSIRIEETSSNGLWRKMWYFIINNRTHQLVLNHYSLMSRKNKRTKFTIVKQYFKFIENDSNMTLHEIPFNKDVRRRALKELTKMFEVVK